MSTSWAPVAHRPTLRDATHGRLRVRARSDVAPGTPIIANREHPTAPVAAGWTAVQPRDGSRGAGEETLGGGIRAARGGRPGERARRRGPGGSGRGLPRERSHG